MAELVKEFSLERVTPSPAVFDMQKLYWLNRHYIAQCEPDRLVRLALPFFKESLPAEIDPQTRAWFQQLTALLAPSVDKLEELPARASLVFHFDPTAAIAAAENADVLKSEKTPAVMAAFAEKISGIPTLVTAEAFKATINEVKSATGAK